MAAIDSPALTRQDGQDIYSEPKDAELTLSKIITILCIAKLHSQRALVLGAFGCGAFHNPPAAIATLFRHALTELPEFQNQFEVVVFSIIERSGSNNLVPWKNVCKEFV